ncbi:MAG: 4Fe-4S dicluster domain-containing protein [Deltaproteobacteria bacterium]|nr:4Fe-4S dicluster domain-containing protein [Deltaproteobacteria bacterium]
MGKIEIDSQKCISCGDCTLTCPSILLADGQGIRVVDEEYCTLCGHCLALCPVKAITIEGMNLREFPDLPEDLEVPPETLAAFLRSRRSCRVFAEKEVDREVLEKLVDIARYAPTGHNSQNFQFMVIKEKNLIRALAKRTAIFFGNLYKMLSAPGINLPPWLQSHMRGFRLNWEYYQAGKDRIFRNAPALIIIHAPAENVSSAQNCSLAMAHIILQAQAMGLGTCIIGYFITAAERDPSIIKELEIPKENKIFTCCTVGYPVLKFKRLVERKPPAVRWL